MCSFQGCLKREPWALSREIIAPKDLLGSITNEKASHIGHPDGLAETWTELAKHTVW